MTTEAMTKPGHTKRPPDEPFRVPSPQLPSPTVSKSSGHYHEARPVDTVDYAKETAKASRLAAYKQRQWLQLLEKEHSPSSPQQWVETVEMPWREPLGRANATYGNEGMTWAPWAPHEDWGSVGPAGPTAGPHPVLAPQSPGKGPRFPQTSPVYRYDRSPGKVTPQKSRPESPEIAASSPKIRVLLASSGGSPKAQRYNGFPGVPAYIGAPEVIVFTPRHSHGAAATTALRADAAPDQGGQQSPAESSSPRRESDVDEAALIDKRGRPTFLQMWVICSVVAGTLSLPFGLLSLSYFSTGSGVERSTPSTTSMSTLLVPSMASSPANTPDHFSGVPASCFRPVRLSANVSVVSSNYPHRSTNGLQRAQHEVFCVFNSSRLGRANYMTLVDMPLDFCTSIVYWSLAITDSGVVQSRVDDFDHTDVGLFHWRFKLSTLRLRDTKIMVTVGGYPEESAYFSRLGRDPGAMARFVSSLMTIVRRSFASGVVIHWAEPKPGCGRRDDGTTLSLLVDAIRRAYRVSGAVAGGGEIAVVLPEDRTVASGFIMVVADRVEWLFLQTHLIAPAAHLREPDICRGWGLTKAELVDMLTARAGVYTEKICSGFSLAPYLGEGRGNNATAAALSSATSPDTGRRGTTTMVDVCGSTRDPPCKARADDACLIFRKLNQRGNASSPMPIYIFEGRNSMQYTLVKRTSVRKVCAVVYDVDLDNFRTECPSLNISVFANLRHFAKVVENATLSSELQLSRPCP